MEIRRVEAERIKPPAASEHGGHVENMRRQRQPYQEKHREREENEPERAEQEDVEEKSAAATVYHANGHLEHPPPDGETHTIDFTV